MKATSLTISLLFFWLLVGASAAPQLREVIATAEFKKRDDAAFLVIKDGTETIDILWSFDLLGETRRSFPVTLSSGTRYVFTIEEEQYSPLEEAGMRLPDSIDRKHFMSTRQTLVRISLGEQVLFDREICEVHNRKMKRIDAPIIYGLVWHEGKHPTREVYKSRFPHYREISFGGCCIAPQKTELMFVCGDCKTAHAKWEEENRDLTN
ncbi:MAG: hypothetical protein EOP84_10605 [Verrucomicrobiaceae bacterium]|nr:MAG: hypothetical protein EOP84_10605 [Verrucomicrobiaceae bacterium]